ECGRVEPVLAALSQEAEAWDAAYMAHAREYASWQARASVWRSRIAETRERLMQMRQILNSPLELEYGNRAE
ncbi:MAG TPA: hypothetical protein VK416_14430, partial [Thermoanaerobaculia bacterium]|nr:hypothetical protein [Thermoanaerobaculia bacterium]